MTKGAGMIMPNMATTLGFVMTDAEIAPAKLRGDAEREPSSCELQPDQRGRRYVHQRHGRGACKRRIGSRRLSGDFQKALTEVLEDPGAADCRATAKERANSSRSMSAALADNDGAERIARAIANSPLVKTAIAGSDPNWGRILSAAGNAGVAFDPSKTDIWMQDMPVCAGRTRGRFLRGRS